MHSGVYATHCTHATLVLARAACTISTVLLDERSGTTCGGYAWLFGNGFAAES